MLFKKSAGISICFILSFLVLAIASNAQVLKGNVIDAKTGEPMTGATVQIKETGKKEFVQLDGIFSFKNLSAGTYEVIISFSNYKTYTERVTINAGKTTEMKVQMESSVVELTGVNIVTGNSGAERNIRVLEKNANQLVNVLSAKNIQLLPDITVANVLQRVSGVTVEKNSAGEARYPIIRGMEKRYINTLINGIKIPSPDNKSRFIPLDLFPSEILERLEVSKSLTPSMEGDAIGGTINLVMKDAPVSKLFQANISMGYNNIFGDQSFEKFDKSSMNKLSPAQINGSTYVAKPTDFSVAHLNYTSKNKPVNTTIGITYGNRFGKDKKLGALFSGSFQNIMTGTHSTFFLPNAQPNLNNIPQFVDLYSRQYSTQNQRIGLNSKFDYKINQRNKISWFNTFVRLDVFQTRINSDTVALNSLVTESFRSTWQYQSIYNSTVQGIHQVSPSFLVDWSAGFSSANNHIPDQSSFSHQFPVSYDPAKGIFTRGTPDILNGMSRNWIRNSDKDLSAYINVTKKMRFLRKALEIKAGGLIRDKKRDNFYNAYSLNPLLGAQGNQLYTNINSAQFTFTAANATPGLNGNNYTFNEDVWAGYVQGKWKLSAKLEMLGGVRVEGTHQHYETELDKSVPAKSGTITYTDLLPSVQFKFELNKHHDVRLAYYRAIARPQFAELIPDGPDDFETFKEKGDPVGLKHSLADNLDLRYEFLSGNADQVLVGVFYKRIQDPIEYSAIKVGATAQNLIPINIGTATNYGFEAVVTKYFGVFGVSANYTYTQSRVTNDHMLYYYYDNVLNYTTKIVSETRPLQGQANHIGNLSLLFKHPKLGLDAQFALVYTGERISLVSPYVGLHYWQQPYTGIDFSFEKRIVKKLTFYGKMNNLANSPAVGSLHIPYDTYIKSSGSRSLALQTDQSSKIIVQKDYVKTSFLFGLRYKL